MMKTIRRVWSNRLGELRRKHRLTIRAVAEACGISATQYYMIEYGRANPTLANAMTLARFYNKTVYHIWTEWRGRPMSNKRAAKTPRSKRYERRPTKTPGQDQGSHRAG